jgi:NitT/TauT family transport system ATP-binding protein
MLSLELEVAEKRYPGASRPALVALELAAAAGEFLALVGPSGCGKSTLLGILAGLDRDYRGHLRFQVDQCPIPAPRLGYIFQEPRLMPWLSAEENLRLVLRRHADGENRAREALTAVGLGEWGAAYPGQLSGGMQRRLALARAFCVEPQLLLMDEPFVSLDAPTADALRAQVSDLWQRYRPTVIFVTHNLREALALADRIVFLSAAPGRALLDFPLTLARPRMLEDRAVGELQQRLLSDYPVLLQGRAEPEQQGGRV